MFIAATHDAAMIALGDVSNLSSHILHPTIQHDVASLCLICGNSATCRNATNGNPNARAMQSLLQTATSSDLDLKSTESVKIRGLVLLHANKVQPTTTPFLLRFVADLTLHVGYSVQHATCSKDMSLQFHALFVFFTHFDRDDASKQWLRDILNRSERVVIVAPNNAITFINETFADCKTTNMTLIYFNDLHVCVNLLLHTSMTTKHRMTTADLARMDKHKNLTIVENQPLKYVFF